MLKQKIQPLPVTPQECKVRGWDSVDIVLVSGDAYVDHPSFGIALIGRLLESHGYRVAVLPQPRFDTENDFLRFGRPRLFFGISGGNLDSIVANYSGNGKVRDFDSYSPGGNPWRSAEKSRENRYRPDRAVLIYANLARKAYRGTTIVLGGIEASLRRFIHYDYIQKRLRGSHLTDAKGDLLVYGMAEKTIVEIAGRLAAGKNPAGIGGCCVRMHDGEIDLLKKSASARGQRVQELPSWEEIGQDLVLFMAAEKTIDRQARARTNSILIQKQQAAWSVQYPPTEPLSDGELDQLYELGFSRRPHPHTPDIPAYRSIKNSVTIVRGCSGNCSFCAISRHQGPATTSRSVASVVGEIEAISGQDGFDGTISDLGGPTANLFGTSCSIGSCPNHDCLFPTVCKNLVIDEEKFLSLLDQVLQVEGVKHAFISSGLRTGILQNTPKLLEKLISRHVPGNLKIAPEHTEKEVLDLMHKESHQQLSQFIVTYRAISKRLGKKTGITPYIISAHPGCSEAHTREMVNKLQKLDLDIRQFQDFTPTPGTLSTAMYVTGIHPKKGTPIEVARNQAERKRQRVLIEAAFFPRDRKSTSSREHPRNTPPVKKRKQMKKRSKRSR